MTDRPPPSLLERLRQQPANSALWPRFVELYATWLESWLGRVARLPSGSRDAEDVVRAVLEVVCRNYPAFRQSNRPGSFRVWLRRILVDCLREYQKKRRGAGATADAVPAPLVDQLEDPRSELSRAWDEGHHAHVVAVLLEKGQRRFPPYAWEAFRRTALGGQTPSRVANELKVSAGAVLLARARVLAWLRQESGDLLD